MRDGAMAADDPIPAVWSSQALTRRLRAIPASDSDPAAWQERHSPTEAVDVTLSQTRKTSLYRRRKADKRMWDAIQAEGGDLVDAAEEIAEACMARLGVVAVRTQRFIRADRGPSEGPSARQMRILRLYDRWCIEAPCASDVVQILVHGQSCRQQDDERRQGHGKALAGLIEALKVYARVAGWR